MRTSMPRASVFSRQSLCRALSLLFASMLLLAPISDAFAAGHRSGSFAGAARSARPGNQPRVNFSGRHETRRSGGARSYSQAARKASPSSRRGDARPVKRARKLQPVPLPHVTDRPRDLESLPHRRQRMPSGLALPLPVPRQLLVFLDQDQPQSLGRELARTYGLEVLSAEAIPLLRARVQLMRVRGARSQEVVLASLRHDPRVRSVQPNHRYLHTGAAGQRYSNAAEAEASRTSGIPQYAPRKIGLPEAHQLALGRHVLIAVIDSAVDGEHPELRGAVVRTFNAAGAADAAPDFHGTAIAGLIRAHGLIESAAPEARILAVRAFRTGRENGSPETTSQILITAVNWAVMNGAKVLNMSFIGAHDAALLELLQAANQKGVVVVAAAGNGGATAPPVYPAAYPGVIAVTAVDEADHPYEYANRGNYIAVAAPGVDILAPVEHGGYAYVSGTSFAAAYVSGIAALLLERDPTLDPHTIADLIATGAEDLGPEGRDDDFGAGRVNAYSSLKLLSHGLAAKRSD
jgi:subtilisin family serine protease